MTVRSLTPLSSLHTKTKRSALWSSPVKSAQPAPPILLEQVPVGWGCRKSRMALALLLRQSLHGVWGLASSSVLHSLGEPKHRAPCTPCSSSRWRVSQGAMPRQGQAEHPRRQERHARIPSGILEACRVPSPVTGTVNLPTSYICLSWSHQGSLGWGQRP